MYLHARIPAIVSLLLGCLLIPGIAAADRLVMGNGDVISGTVTRVADGKIYIHPSYADEFGVNLADVASVDAAQALELELADGRELTGQLSVSAEGSQVVVSPEGQTPIALADVVAAAAPKAHYERISHAEVSATLNSGNTDSQNSLIYADTWLRLGEHRHYADISFRRDETENVKTKEQDLFNYSYNWMFNEPWFAGGSFTFERDPIRDLDYRYTVGLLAGRDILNDANRFLSISFGPGYSEEEIGDVTDSGAAGLWKLFYTHKLRGGSLSLFHDHNLTYQFYAENNAIFKSNTGFRFDLIADVYATVSLRYDYETEPAPGRSKDDTTFALGIGAAF